MDWNNPSDRANFIERVGIDEYNKAFKAHLDASTISTIGGHAIRPVGSMFGTLYLVGDTGRAFQNIPGAETFARENPQPGHAMEDVQWIQDEGGITPLQLTRFNTYAPSCKGGYDTDILRSPQADGFVCIETGGNCTAWQKNFKIEDREVSILVTDEDGLGHDLTRSESMIVGVYDINTNVLIHIWTQKNAPLDANRNAPMFESLGESEFNKERLRVGA